MHMKNLISWVCRECLIIEKRNSIGASGLPFSFFLHHFVSMRRMVTRVGALESPDLGGPFKYFEYVHRTSRKFFRAVWSQILQFLWTLRKNGSKFGIPKIRKKFILETENFFSLIFLKIILESQNNIWVVTKLSETYPNASEHISLIFLVFS